MTVTTEHNTITHIAVEGQDTYPYDFITLAASHMFVKLGGLDYTAGFSVTGIGNQAGGNVILDTPISAVADGKQLILTRIVPLTQLVDYGSYDAFPADTHEEALDLLAMQSQQSGETAKHVLTFPLGDPADGEFPSVAQRSERFAFFDVDGNATAVEAELAAPAVYRVDIQDGLGGEDSRLLLQSEVLSGGPNFPKIGFININSPNGPVQLNDAGKIPVDLLQIVGVKLRGPFRGDNLCDKPNDELLACTVPDHRNPSERFPDLAPLLTNGDAFVITMADGELSGEMNLLVAVGDIVTSAVTVEASDFIMFLEELKDPDTEEIILYEGWYHFPKLIELGSAVNTSYDDVGNTYVLGTNVQVAMDAIDDVLVNADQVLLTENNVSRTARVVPGLNLNAIIASGLYRADGSVLNKPTSSNYTVHAIINDLGNITQFAHNVSNGSVYTRIFNVSWSSWTKLVIEPELNIVDDKVDVNAGNIATLDSVKIEAVDYAAPTVGGTLKAKLSGNTLYLSNDGSNL